MDADKRRHCCRVREAVQVQGTRGVMDRAQLLAKLDEMMKTPLGAGNLLLPSEKKQRTGEKLGRNNLIRLCFTLHGHVKLTGAYRTTLAAFHKDRAMLRDMLAGTATFDEMEAAVRGTVGRRGAGGKQTEVDEDLAKAIAEFKAARSEQTDKLAKMKPVDHRRAADGKPHEDSGGQEKTNGKDHSAPRAEVAKAPKVKAQTKNEGASREAKKGAADRRAASADDSARTGRCSKEKEGAGVKAKSKTAKGGAAGKRAASVDVQAGPASDDRARKRRGSKEGRLR